MRHWRTTVHENGVTEQMAQMARGLMRRKIELLTPALEGRVVEHHRFILRMQLRRLEQADVDLRKLDARIATKLEPRTGNIFLKTALVEAATSASRKKGGYLKDKYWRLKARRGPKRAARPLLTRSC